MTEPLRDLKAALGNASKPDITHVRIALLNYTARSCEYGNDKYERANFRRPTGGAVHATPTREDFERYRAYLRAAMSHIAENLDAMETHLATDPRLEDIEGMKRAAYAVDTDVTPGAKIGASLLPHISPACASLNMALTQATDCGLLPRDPGTPWRAAAATEKTVVPTGLALFRLGEKARIAQRSHEHHGRIVVVLPRHPGQADTFRRVKLDGRSFRIPVDYLEAL